MHIVNARPEDEKLNRLPDILIGQEKAIRVMTDFEANPERYGCNLLGPEAMAWYYQNYFYDRAPAMDYPITEQALGRDDTLLNLLSVNAQAVADYGRAKGHAPDIYLRQSFMAAARAFKAIDAPTRGVIVPHGAMGHEIITALCAAYLPDKEFKLLRRAQQFTVNLFPQALELLAMAGVVKEIQEGTGILFLTDARYYSDEFGLSETPEGKMEVLCG